MTRSSSPARTELVVGPRHEDRRAEALRTISWALPLVVAVTAASAATWRGPVTWGALGLVAAGATIFLARRWVRLGVEVVERAGGRSLVIRNGLVIHHVAVHDVRAVMTYTRAGNGFTARALAFEVRGRGLVLTSVDAHPDLVRVLRRSGGGWMSHRLDHVPWGVAQLRHLVGLCRRPVSRRTCVRV